ncbi:16S rRNA (guanine(966)-N(2))-methyltransferase RsmD [Pseudooceanicola aestuarii]|uniref:16S rRNA (guanine(966)-N(2))-methyltransferase RsmD n=1 Tax=Pseudooceanicola aestuarii TaxID=2697319 RepID=UPI0013D44BF0|nr:16S rRNA (guanine(966)-N(2))-methyltransferase RsmD [Pseudooceanicola aestuarii]
MRIVAGRFRGRRLATLGKGDAGAHLRPTTDRVRESLFSILTGGRFGDPVAGARVLDLFAGTGALGIEALSRGAAHVTLVDDGRLAGRLLRENIALLDIAAETRLMRANATRLPTAPGAADLVFLDPPYGKGLGERALASALGQGWVADTALVVWEDSAPVTPPEGWQILDTRQFGDTRINFLRAAP